MGRVRKTIDSKEFYVYVGKKLKGVREFRGLIQQEVADQIGISRCYLSQIESGDVMISLENFLKLCWLMDIEYGKVLPPEEGVHSEIRNGKNTP